MKFIRVHGRVVPINDSSSPPMPNKAQMKEREQRLHTTVKANAAVGASMGVAMVAGHNGLMNALSKGARSAEQVGAHLLKSRSLKVAGLGYAGAISASVVGAYQKSKALKIKKTTVAEGTKQSLKETGAFFGGLGVPLIPYHAFMAHASKLRPLAKKVGEEISFRRARTVKPIYKSSGVLLGRGK